MPAIEKWDLHKSLRPTQKCHKGYKKNIEKKKISLLNDESSEDK